MGEAAGFGPRLKPARIVETETRLAETDKAKSEQRANADAPPQLACCSLCLWHASNGKAAGDVDDRPPPVIGLEQLVAQSGCGKASEEGEGQAQPDVVAEAQVAGLVDHEIGLRAEGRHLPHNTCVLLALATAAPPSITSDPGHDKEKAGS